VKLSKNGITVDAMHIRLAHEQDHENWNRFVIENSPGASYSLYNLFEWRMVLQNSYSYPSYYFIAESGSDIIGCFPLMHVKSMLLGNRLICLPFTDHGCGPIVAGQDAQVLKSLLNEADRLAVKLKADLIQVNSPKDDVGTFAFEFQYKKLYDYFTFVLDLNRPIDNIWSSFKKQVRNSIKKAEKSSVKVTIGNTFESMCRIHRLHINNMKRLGTPPHSGKFFMQMWKQMHPTDNIRTYLATCEGRDVAGIVLFPHRESVRWGVGVVHSDYRWLNPLYPLLWEAIRWSKENGYATFDMGGTRPASGNYDFKEAWIGKNQVNGRIVGLNHLYHFLNKNEANIVSLENPSYARLSNLWRKYVPSLLANSLGPYLRKQIAM
jgi:CelD/BcsL family acetyltransferase involved in cellulose biosynthesis